MKDSVLHRLELLDRANSDPELRALILAACKRDVVTFAEWCWTYNPRLANPYIPFNLFPRQIEFLRWLTDRYELKEDAIAEKSRDVGFTWLAVLWLVHRWLFYKGFKGTFGSRKKDLVDKLGDPDSIFEKARMLIASLPWWMQPRSWKDNELRLLNQGNGAILTGEGGDNIGRGGRSSIYILDEAAFVERAEKVDAALSANSDCKIKISTPNGPGNVFYRQRFSGSFPVFSFLWLDDPRKNYWELRDENGAIVATGAGRNAPLGAIYPWYEKQKKSLDSIVLAQEVDLDYMASIEGTCIPHEWVMAAVELCDRLQLPRTDPVAGMDVADGGKNANVVVVREGAIVTEIDDWKTSNTTQTAYRARDFCHDRGVKRLNYDAIGVGAGVGGTLESCDDLKFRLCAIVGGASPSDTTWEQFGFQTSQQLFINLRAELWWLARRRFEKTYEHVNGEAVYPLDELISVPNHPMLIAQLSQPLRQYTDSGKTKIESKDDMARRGVESPDFADALIYSLAADRSPVWGNSDLAWG